MERMIKRGKAKAPRSMRTWGLWRETVGEGEESEQQHKKKEGLVENRRENEKSRRREENGSGMNGPHGLVQPQALRNGAGAEVPKLHLLKWSLAPKVNQSPEPHPQMSKKKKKNTAEINISAACTGGGRHGGGDREREGRPVEIFRVRGRR